VTRPLERLLAGRKAWSQPPFWSLDAPTLFRTATPDRERIESNFEGYVQGAYKANGVVFACMMVRQLVFSEARFLFRRFKDGRPTALFGDASLSLLEKPWPNGTTGELLARMEQDASLAGNFYATVRNGRIRRMRPDWVTIVSSSPSGDPNDLDAEILAFIYDPPAFRGLERKPVILTPDQVAHYSPIPDPEAQWRGMSWLTPVLDEIKGDKAASKHKLKFFENGAIPGFAITYDKEISPEAFTIFKTMFDEGHAGLDNAYKTLHLGGGADVKSVGTDLKQVDFKVTQGAGETRIAAAAGVHPVIAGLSEGMQGSSLNAGNFASARRRFADGTMRPLWRMAAPSLENLIAPPEGASLWYDDRDIAFLKEDAKDDAEILSKDAQTIRTLVEAGYDADAAVTAVTDKDLRQLTGKHSGLYSVQLQEAGAGAIPQEDPTA
jgi:phage portal protein BeeE